MPAYHSHTPNDNGLFSEVQVMYSDDHGKTWYVCTGIPLYIGPVRVMQQCDAGRAGSWAG